jgi:threonyl-tRNA synthetase
MDPLRHSCAHLLAAAVMELWPDTKRAIGPAIENGFYYDFDFKQPITEADLPKIEAKMRELLSAWKEFIKEEVTSEEAKKRNEGNPYKQELIDEFSSQKQQLTIYKSGNFEDLCRGGHCDTPNLKLQNFKLLTIAGAYWRGSEKNKMLTRIYGTVFPTKKELDDYLLMLEEAKKRDHRKLGQELDLFVISETIGKGLPLLTPKGTVIKDQIIAYEKQIEKEAGFEFVWTPSIAKNEIYKKTGHWEHYRDMMYAPFGIENEQYVLKPMNCPHHYMIYASKPKSYRDLPVRYSEIGTCYRFEKSGELGGLTRVRALSIDDSHILMREEDIDAEFDRCISLVLKMFKAFGLSEYYVRLSLNDPADHIKYIADSETWKKAGALLEKIVKRNKLSYVVGSGEASFYGPKLDFMVKDALGRNWQMSTLQLDLFMGKKLNLTYIDEHNNEKHPIILHRGLTGSLERTLGLLIEHFGGAFPLWLSPIQVLLIPISENNIEYTKKIRNNLEEKNIRVELDNRNERMQARLRDGVLQKIPYIVILGNKEQTANTISYRERNGKTTYGIHADTFIQNLLTQIEKKSI